MLQSGVANLSVRSICIEAGINLGMFYYYFKTKEKFIKVIFESFNEDLHYNWKKESQGISDPIEKLKKALFLSAYLIKEKKGIIENIFKDFDFTNKTYMQFLREMHDRWRLFYVTLIEDCKKDSSLGKGMENDQIIAILIGSVKYYSTSCEMQRCENYYEEVGAFIDCVIEKLKYKKDGSKEAEKLES
ncbi:MAG: TetR/AcrR family transcriptional regulator [Endomicrobium sp.]|nr:TetR/AcrR family transcriptional regulator [Endomicrobium sp.]